MSYSWRKYTPSDSAAVESWIDETARKYTGCDDGWADYYDYWINEPETEPENNFFCRMISTESVPIAVMSMGLHDGELTVSEFIVSPEHRSNGHGSAILKELITAAERIIANNPSRFKAVIMVGNTASLRAFEKAGFRLQSIHPDGDVMYYTYNK